MMMRGVALSLWRGVVHLFGLDACPASPATSRSGVIRPGMRMRPGQLRRRG